MPADEIEEAKAEAETLPSVDIQNVDLQWVQVLGEGWASPLNGNKPSNMKTRYYIIIGNKISNMEHEFKIQGLGFGEGMFAMIRMMPFLGFY